MDTSDFIVKSQEWLKEKPMDLPTMMKLGDYLLSDLKVPGEEVCRVVHEIVNQIADDSAKKEALEQMVKVVLPVVIELLQKKPKVRTYMDYFRGGFSGLQCKPRASKAAPLFTRRKPEAPVTPKKSCCSTVHDDTTVVRVVNEGDPVASPDVVADTVASPDMTAPDAAAPDAAAPDAAATALAAPDAAASDAAATDAFPVAVSVSRHSCCSSVACSLPVPCQGEKSSPVQPSTQGSEAVDSASVVLEDLDKKPVVPETSPSQAPPTQEVPEVSQ